VIKINKISELAIKEGCFNTQLPCPDPVLWLAVGVIVGLWIASCLWVAYIRELKAKQEENGVDE